MKILNRRQKALLWEYINTLDCIEIKTLVHQKIPLRPENVGWSKGNELSQLIVHSQLQISLFYSSPFSLLHFTKKKGKEKEKL